MDTPHSRNTPDFRASDLGATTEVADALSAAAVSRRSFLAASGAVGGGLLLAATFPLLSPAEASAAAASGAGAQITLYARIAPTGVVTPWPTSGFGARIVTTLPMVFAEELGVAWKDVVIEQADYAGGALGNQVAIYIAFDSPEDSDRAVRVLQRSV